VIEAAEHLTRLLEESKHKVSPITVANPLRITVESASVVKVTSLVELGVKVEELLALKAPVTVNPLLTVVVPVPAPILKVVAAVKMFTVPEVLVKSPPLTARSPEVVTFPVSREVPSTVKVPLAVMFPVEDKVTPVDP